VNGELVPPGDHELVVMVVDEAGNRSEPPAEFDVRVVRAS
jgi:hypothetical protein